MKEIYFATSNKGKVLSVNKTLSKYGIEVIHKPLDLPEIRSEDLSKIAKVKVLFAYENVKKPCIAIDSGFYIDSLKGFPKAFVNFALNTIDIEGILKLVENKNRDCAFRNCLAYFDQDLKDPVFFEGVVEGTISEAPKGEMQDFCWSKLFLIFIPNGETKTLGQMTEKEYQEWRNKRSEDSYTTKFAEWFSSKK
ncbi:MAG: non-canonical purine NTP pyrophosphatase [archaeon]